jgi:CxxC-x17-CxxC domain-containing protein
MKKSVIEKDRGAAPSGGADVTELMAKMLERFAALDRKLDTLLSRSGDRAAQPKPYPNTFQRFDRMRAQEEPRVSPNGNFNQRTLHKAVCADCGNGCEVPFKPTGDRPVYCKDCFSKRKSSGALYKPNIQMRPAAGAHVQKEEPDKAPRRAAVRKAAVKKAAKKKKR